LDVDTRDEGVFADAIARHGETPVVIRSGRGHHQAWYRHAGERRDTVSWRKRGLPIDILGGGFVVAPPSRGSYGAYQFVQGSLEDIYRLPVIRGLQAPLQPAQKRQRIAGKLVGEGARNNSLWRQCMIMARRCYGPGGLLEMARAENAKFPAPLDDWEVEKVVNSAWRYEEQGLNRVSDRYAAPAFPLSYDDVDDLMTKSPDAFILLTWLRRHNFDRDRFVIANAMADHMPGGRWTTKRLAAARSLLQIEGKIVQVQAPGVASGPAVYRWLVNSDYQ
jgi:Primase C terminal 1 (PriCT-1)/Bifunctional DNA primase/polymerase, N-terminal